MSDYDTTRYKKPLCAVFAEMIDERAGRTANYNHNPKTGWFYACAVGEGGWWRLVTEVSDPSVVRDGHRYRINNVPPGLTPEEFEEWLRLEIIMARIKG